MFLTGCVITCNLTGHATAVQICSLPEELPRTLLCQVLTCPSCPISCVPQILLSDHSNSIGFSSLCPFFTLVYLDLSSLVPNSPPLPVRNLFILKVWVLFYPYCFHKSPAESDFFPFLFLRHLVHCTDVEIVTFCLTGSCSNPESHHGRTNTLEDFYSAAPCFYSELNSQRTLTQLRPQR